MTTFPAAGDVLRELSRRLALTIAGTGESRRWPPSPVMMLQDPRGGKKPVEVVSIDAAPRSRIAVSSDSGRRLESCEEIFARAGFEGHDERLYLLASAVHHIPRRQIPEHLGGFSLRKVETIRRRTERRIKKLPQVAARRNTSSPEVLVESSCPVRREILPSGRSVWAFLPHGPVFLAILLQERQPVVRQRKRAQPRGGDRLAA